MIELSFKKRCNLVQKKSFQPYLMVTAASVNLESASSSQSLRGAHDSLKLFASLAYWIQKQGEMLNRETQTHKFSKLTRIKNEVSSSEADFQVEISWLTLCKEQATSCLFIFNSSNIVLYFTARSRNNCTWSAQLWLVRCKWESIGIQL